MRRILRSFDAIVRCAVGVFEFTQDPDCLLRLQCTVLHHDLQLPDARLPARTPVLEFHMWNERVPSLPPDGADLAWAQVVSRRLIRSFGMVRTYLAAELVPIGPQAVGGITILGSASGSASDLLAHLGFHPHPYSHPLGSFGERWENAYTCSLMWAYNPVSLRGKSLRRLHRTEYWMSTPAFLQRFAA